MWTCEWCGAAHSPVEDECVCGGAVVWQPLTLSGYDREMVQLHLRLVRQIAEGGQ